MESAFANPNMPPLMSPESQSPGLFAVGKANVKESMSDPMKSKIATAMLGNALSQIGKGLSAAPIERKPSRFDLYGNPIG